MNECENILKFNDFEKNWKAEEPKKTKRTEVGKDVIKEFLEYDSEREELIDLILQSTKVDRDILDDLSDEELEEILNNLELDNEGDIEGNVEEIEELSSDNNLPYRAINDEDIKTFESFSVKPAPKEEKQPKYTILGEEKEPKSNPNFGYAAVRAQEIKKITDFNVIDPATPKERTIGGNAGVYIDNDIMSGRVNRIEGKNVYIESPDDPLVIKKFSLKDAVKLKKD